MGIPTVVILGMVVHVPFPWLVFAMYGTEEVVKAAMCVLYFKSKRWIRQLAGTAKKE